MTQEDLQDIHTSKEKYVYMNTHTYLTEYKPIFKRKFWKGIYQIIKSEYLSIGREMSLDIGFRGGWDHK